MLILIGLQAFLAITYFATSSLHMDWPLNITLLINFLGLAYLWRHHQISHELDSVKVRTARLVFTITLFLLEFLIDFVTNQSMSDGTLGFINDSEVFVTGILIGILWRKEILGKDSD